MSATPFTIAGRPIGPDHPPYVVAELSGNHNGELSRALQLMDAAKAAGADAIKIQTYTADTITIDCAKKDFSIEGGPWSGYTLHSLYKEAHTPWEWHEALFDHGRKLGLPVFSSPFDPTAIAFLKKLNAPAYKIASFEAIDTPLIAEAARTGKPLIISTGMADLGEIQDAVDAARGAGCASIALLHCISAYPAPVEDANLRTIPHLRDAFSVEAGLSDHTLGTSVAIAAVSLGATIVEKHMTLRRADGGPDAAFSLEPDEFKAMADGCRTAWKAVGRVNYAREESEKGSMVFRRSLYAVRDIAAGQVLTPDDVRSIRPGYGLPPKHLPEILGRRAARAIDRGTPISWELVADRG
ncbi:MAG: pseudaminic acid synthase [Alphaproteobacteria bacterium]|nr:pseudaminic acid synthase [Alphaproteobacteria bacterium]